jgi:TetR/AcrR family tetracycline transcriptional repressor
VSIRLPEPIWPTRRSLPRPQISEDAVVDAALALLDEGGLDAVTMRAVAQRLGVTAPTVYWHVESKDGLFDRLFDRLCGEVPLPTTGSWRLRLTTLATNTRAVFAAHRDSAKIAIGRFPLGPHGLNVTETALAALAQAGLDTDTAAHAAFLFFSYITSFAYQETILPAPSLIGTRSDALTHVRDYLAGLSTEDFPHLTASATALSTNGLDRRFTFGLNALLTGITEPQPGQIRAGGTD